ncbi:hypothetical protein [Mesorhizobium sp. M0895]|uniref:hypothetical protein n=1 Tax=Mesorhizobium sp. M0895 TaxID=2957019 RepID=UPI003338F8E8
MFGMVQCFLPTFGDRLLSALRAELDCFWSKTLAAYKAAVEQPPEESSRAHVQQTRPSNGPSWSRRRSRALYTTCSVEIAETVLEPKTGGYLYDRGTDGSVCRWARVLAYDPPNRLLLSWNNSPQWQIESDREKTSEWEARFTETEHRIRIEIERRKLARHSKGWESVRDGVAGDQGWPLYLPRFADLVARQA